MNTLKHDLFPSVRFCDIDNKRWFALEDIVSTFQFSAQTAKKYYIPVVEMRTDKYVGTDGEEHPLDLVTLQGIHDMLEHVTQTPYDHPIYVWLSEKPAEHSEVTFVPRECNVGPAKIRGLVYSGSQYYSCRDLCRAFAKSHTSIRNYQSKYPAKFKFLKYFEEKSGRVVKGYFCTMETFEDFILNSRYAQQYRNAINNPRTAPSIQSLNTDEDGLLPFEFKDDLLMSLSEYPLRELLDEIQRRVDQQTALASFAERVLSVQKEMIPCRPEP